MSLSLQADATNIQKNINVEFKADSVTDKNNTGKAEVIVKEGVQAALEKLKEY